MGANRQKSLKIEKKISGTSSWTAFSKKVQKYCSWNFIIQLLTVPKHTMQIGWLLLIVELILNVLIVLYVPYTEIDWKAYMQECEGFLNGTLDYCQLKGDTGPLVYPAGFVYLYSAFYYMTTQGSNIRLAQYIFVTLYLIQLYLTIKLYAKTRKVPPYAIILVTLTSYRVHSLYSLRLFNDSWAVLLFFGALHCFLDNRWAWGSVLYSLAVSIKMNILLYAPCLFCTYLVCCGGWKGAVKYISLCAVVQLILGAPFLWTNARCYIEGSFDIRRIFEHKWTVNFRFVPRDIFESRMFHFSLLGLHLMLLGLFLPYIWKYLSSYAKLKQIEEQLKPQLDQKGAKGDNKRKNKRNKDNSVKFQKNEQQFLNAFEAGLKQQQHFVPEENDEQFTVDFSNSSQLLVLPFLVTNLIGIACARSLHYQFYSWYFHGLLYMGWSTRLAPMLTFLLLGVLEACWNTYPSTALSSGALHVCHLVLMVGLFQTMRQSSSPKKTN